MKACIEISIEEAFTLEERKNFEANARLAGRDVSSHLRAILFPPAVVDPRVAAADGKAALVRECVSARRSHGVAMTTTASANANAGAAEDVTTATKALAQTPESRALVEFSSGPVGGKGCGREVRV